MPNAPQPPLPPQAQQRLFARLSRRYSLPVTLLIVTCVAVLASEALTALIQWVWQPFPWAEALIVSGAIPAIITPLMASQTYRLLRELSETVDALHTEIALRLEAEAKLYKLATTDELTGLYTRRYFLDRLNEQILQTRREPNRPVSVLYIDIDQFETINRHHGEAVGDEVLCQVSKLFRTILRPGDSLGRMEGEEFAVLLPNTQPAAAMACAERLRLSLLNPDALHLSSQKDPSKTPSVTVSIGIATVRAHETVASLLHRTNSALRLAKSAGGNAAFYDGDAPRLEV